MPDATTRIELGSGTSGETCFVLDALAFELGADFDVVAIGRIAYRNADAEHVEMFVRSVREQTVRSRRTEIGAASAGGDRSLNSRRPSSWCGADRRTSQATSHFSSPRRSTSR
jgi:uncharacterized SAM-dependent methyltransferase